MKSLITTIVLSFLIIVTTGCGTEAKAEDSFEDFANEFYTQMMTDGEVTAEVDAMYKTLTEDYSDSRDGEIYENLEGMYTALATEGESATPYQLELMRILND